MAKFKISVLIYRIIALGAIAFLTIGAAGVSQGAMTDCIDATCRISASDGGVGSGCVFEISQGRVYVLTAAHVVGKDLTVRCEFWRLGHQSQPLAGQVIARSEIADAALIAVPEEVFGGMLPSVIPLAPREYVVPSGTTLTSVGCANGTWSTGWKGHALGYSGADLHFLPTPANGRSGSAVFDAEGKMIVAVLRARTVNDSEGIATPVQCLYDAFGIQASQSKPQWRESPDATLTQCPGGSCPGGQCPAPTPYLLPYRYKEQYRNQPAPGGAPSQSAAPSPAWPTLPIVQPSTMDLGPTNEKLDKIADLLIRQFQAQTTASSQASPSAPPAVAQPAQPTGPTPAEQAALKTAEEAKTQAAEAKKTSETQAAETKKSLEEIKGSLLQRIGLRSERVMDANPDATPKEFVQAYVKDYLKEHLQNVAEGGGLSALGSLAPVLGVGGVVVVAILIFCGVVIWKLANNKPLAIENITGPDSSATKVVEDLRGHFTQLLDNLRNGFESKFSDLNKVATEAKAAADTAKAVTQIVAGQSTSTPAAK